MSVIDLLFAGPLYSDLAAMDIPGRLSCDLDQGRAWAYGHGTLDTALGIV